MAVWVSMVLGRWALFINTFQFSVWLCFIGDSLNGGGGKKNSSHISPHQKTHVYDGLDYVKGQLIVTQYKRKLVDELKVTFFDHIII